MNNWLNKVRIFSPSFTGLRWSIVGCTVLIFIGIGLRCITHEYEAATW